MSRTLIFLFFFHVAISIFAEPGSYYLTFVPEQTQQIQKADISLKLEGKDVAINEVIYVDTTQRNPEILWHPAGRRTYVFVFDLMYSNTGEILKARRITEAFLQQVGNQDLVAIATISSTEGLKFYCLPTADHDVARAGLNTFGLKNITEYVEGPEGNLYTEQFSVEKKTVELLPDESFLDQIQGYPIAEKDKKEMRPVYLQSLVDLGFVLSILDGRKNVILFTPGVDAGGLNVNLPLRQKVSTRKETAEATTIEHEDIESITDASYERLQKRATLGPRRKPQKQSTEALPDFFEGSDSHFFLFHSGNDEPGLMKKIISKTAGLFLKLDQDTGDAIRQILDSDSHYYAVGFVPPAENLKDLNGIHLEIENSDASTPSFWLLPKVLADYSSNERKAKISESVYKNLGTPSEIYRFWSDFTFQEGNIVIPAFVQVDGPGILKTKTELVDLEFFAYAMMPDGRLYDFSYFLVSLDLANKSLTDKLAKSGVKVWNPLLAGKGPITIRSIILSTQTGELLTHSDQIEITDSMTMSEPFFPSTNLTWILWPNPLQEITKRNVEIHYPYRAGKDLYFTPEVSPVIRNSDTSQVVYFRVYNMTNQNKVPAFGLRLLDQSGRQFELKQVALLQRPDTVEQKGLAFFWKLQSIPQVTPGDYLLKIGTLDPALNKEVTKEIPAKISQ